MCTYQAAHQCNINKPLNLDRCLCHHPPTMSEDQIRRWGNRESQKLPACKQTWNHTFCFNPGQPHHLISMYKRTSEYKCASKYKWHERLKYFICHPREVTWQLSCWDWSLMPSWPSSAAKGSLRQIIWPLGALREASSWDLRLRLATVLGKKKSAKPGELEGQNPKKKNKISRMKICSAKNEGGYLLSREKFTVKCEAIFVIFFWRLNKS